MDPMRQTQFGGMVPRITDHRELPPHAASYAENVDVTSGKLKALKVTNDFTTLHDPDTWLLKPGIPLADIRSIAKPVTPSESSRIRLCVPTQWIGLARRIYESHLTDGGAYEENSIEYDALTFSSLEYTDDGFIWWGYLALENHTFDTDRLYTLHGLNYIVSVVQDTGFYGGPESAKVFPAVSTANDPARPVFRLPLTTPFPEAYDSYPGGPETTRYGYGALSLDDVTGPTLAPTLYFDSELYSGAASVTYRLHNATYIALRFSNNYVEPRRRFFNYAQSNVDQRVVDGELTGALTGGITEVVLDSAAYGDSGDVPSTGQVLLNNNVDAAEMFPYTARSYATGVWTLTVSKTLAASYAEDDSAIIIDPTIDGIEGPPSDLSGRIQLMPGEAVKVSCARTNGYARNKLYRTEDTTRDPQLLAKVDDDSYYDTDFIGLGDTLPPFGNYPNVTLADARARSVMHPNNFGVISDGKVLYLSDVYRPHVYPLEYSIQYLSTILANPVVGRSIIVFTNGDEALDIPGYVYRVGGFREQTTSDLLTDARPLLNILSLCRIDTQLFYVSAEGLMAVSGGGVQNVSTPWFSKNEWNAYAPDNMKGYVNDGVIYLTVDQGVNWRIDLNKEVAAVTRFTSLPLVRGDAQLTWAGKIHAMGKPMRHAFVRIRASEYPVMFKVFDGDGRLRGDVSVVNDSRQRLPVMQLYESMYWQVQANRGTIEEVVVATTAQMLDRASEEG